MMTIRGLGVYMGVGLGLLGAQLVAAQQVAGPAAAALVFRGVTVIDVEQGKRLANQSVVVVGNRIQTLGPAARVQVPAGARVVNAAGKYLIPGLWDMHVHPVEYVDVAFPLFLANGVTGVRDAGSSVPLATIGQWKREIMAGTRVGPRYLVSGPSIDQAPDTQSVVTYHGKFHHNILVPPALARAVVDSLFAAGADFIKPYSMFHAMRWTVAAEARRLGMRFGGHSAGDVRGDEFSDSGATFLDHQSYIPACGSEVKVVVNDSFNVAQCVLAIQRLRQHNTWVTVLNNLVDLPGESSRSIPFFRRYWLQNSWVTKSTYSRSNFYRGYLRQLDSFADRLSAGTGAEGVHQPTSTEEWVESLRADAALDSKFRLVTARRDSLRQHGAILPIVVGTDASYIGGGVSVAALPGFAVAPVLEYLVLTGMTPLEALQTATLNPVRALGATDSLGTVEAGKLADLVLLDADPLADIWNTTRVQAVVANGHYYDRTALDQLLTFAAQEAARARSYEGP